MEQTKKADWVMMRNAQSTLKMVSEQTSRQTTSKNAIHCSHPTHITRIQKKIKLNELGRQKSEK